MQLRIGKLRVEAHVHGAHRGFCADCHWWHIQWDTPGERRGHCRRMAPLTDHSGRTLFPRTTDRQFCGQFAERETPDTTRKNGGAK